MAARLPKSVAPSPPETIPPTCRPGSTITADLPSRLAAIAETTPPAVAP